MYELFINKSIIKLNIIIAVCTTLISFSPNTYAASKDLKQEIKIKALRSSADLKNKIASYLDDVKITQGSISISADLVQVFSKIDNISKEKNDTYMAKGKPAVFQQELDDGSLITLQANEIKYQPWLNMITISGNALLKQAGSEVSGSKITYNTLTEKLDAESNNDETVITILQPTVLKAKKENIEINESNDRNN